MTTQLNTKCTCPSGDGSLRWPCPKHPPAAAQEAVGARNALMAYADSYRTMAKIGDGRVHCFSVACDIEKNMIPHAAPVTAAPADLIERCKEILAWQRTGVLTGDALRAYANARWPDEHDPLQIAEKETAREAFRILAMYTAASTPAAPGIDLREIGGVMAEAEKHVETLHSLCPRASVFECIKRLRKAQAALIDASPKGTTLNEQFGSAEGLGSASHYRQVLERIATQGPHYGPDGTRETWKHWSDIARDALVDSPKGGSEAEVQELVAADLAYDAAEQALVDHYKPTLRRDAGWHLEQERLDAIADSAIARRSAALAAMQASDAEVRDGE